MCCEQLHRYYEIPLICIFHQSSSAKLKKFKKQNTELMMLVYVIKLEEYILMVYFSTLAM